MNGLSKLEYRGYDSAGLAVRNGSDAMEIVKAKGRLRVLAEKTNNGAALSGTCGVGHTRWATHGVPSDINSHPHISQNGKISVVHNGIIENYMELKAFLQEKEEIHEEEIYKSCPCGFTGSRRRGMRYIRKYV